MKKYYLGGLGLLVIILTFFPYNYWDKETVSKPKIIIEPTVEPIKEIKVDIKGEVNRPGVYILAVGNRVIDAIIQASGFTKNADSSLINLSKLLVDEMVIRVYSKEQVKKEVIIEYVEKECICEKVTNDACVDQNTELISINNGLQTDLENIPGIGTTKALAIIAYRTQNGLFTKIEDIKNVVGIGDATYENIKDYITL